MSERTPINMHPSPPEDFVYPHPNDKSFILVLDRIRQQALEAVQASDPSVDNPVIDGYKRGRYEMVLEIIRAYKTQI